jgi:hypothetical protein
MSTTSSKDLRNAVLALHKVLLESQVLEIEKATGHTMSANEQLTSALQDPRFIWLRELSGLAALLDAEAAAKPEDDPFPGKPAAEQLSDILDPPDPDTPFGKRYLRELQDNPAAGLAHGAVRALLADLQH